MHIVEITTESASRRVAHLEVVKAELGLTDTSKDTDLLAVIDAVSGEFERYLERPPWWQSYLIRLPGDGGTFLRLPRWPISAVSQIREGVDSPTVVTASDYELVESGRRDQLYAEDGWVRTSLRDPHFKSSDARSLYYEVTGDAGWACPIRTWTASQPIRVGEWCRATDRTISVRFECTTAGTSHTSEPGTWTVTDGGTTADNDVVWTARLAEEMPENLIRAGIWATKEMFRSSLTLPGGPVGLRSESHGSTKYVYANIEDGAAATFLPPVVEKVLRGYR